MSFSISDFASVVQTPAKSPSANPDGELPRGGISSGKEVPILLLDLSKDFVGKNPRCGGSIGQSGWMCIKLGCDKPTHVKKKHKLLQDNMKGQVVFIQADSSGDLVHGSPNLELSEFGPSHFNKYQDQIQTPESWESLFNLLLVKDQRMADKLSADKFYELANKAAARTGPTLFKAARKLGEKFCKFRDLILGPQD
ncbi:unnamed protein product [Cylindrotheca closterium]|uniref:Uncharacterized protein n=1 Tax=Cylindrotheca closterium TaxID=2856 RepID=A0AAD2PU82_9STRA|nr:unnamed protein product [Cylindrotheca closterium]